MFSVFSNKLIERHKLIDCAAFRARWEDLAVGEPMLYLAISSIEKGTPIPHILIPPDASKDLADEILYEYCINPYLRDEAQWIVDKILVEQANTECTQPTRDVSIRIATSKLNKLVYEEKLNGSLNMIIHDGFVKNLEQLMKDLWDEYLPF